MPLRENETVELKESFDHEDFEAEVVSFLNEEGGSIYIGVDNKGIAKGVPNIDKTMLLVSDSLLDRIAPDCSELTSIHEEIIDGIKVIRVDIQKGYRFYHIKKYGHSPRGCYRRYGSRKKSMTQDEIDRRYRASLPQETIMEKKSPKTNLSFSVFKIYLTSKNVAFSENSFDEDFELRREDCAYNFMAYLLSDQFDESIKVARFKGTGDSGELVMRKEFGRGCIFKVFQEALDYMNSVEQRVKTSFVKGLRKDEYLYDEDVFTEAWKNAVLHNSYHMNQFPQIYLFDDHLEIMSHGNPLTRMSKEEFLRGRSRPLNKTLMKFAINLKLTDQTGKGNKDIVKAYGPDVFEFSDSFLTVKLPYNPLVVNESTELIGGVNGGENLIEGEEERVFSTIMALSNNGDRATTKKIISSAGIGKRTVERHLASLKAKGMILRVGADKNGYWEVAGSNTDGGVNGGVNGGINFAELREEERVFSAIMSLGNKNEVATTQKIVSSAGIKEKSIKHHLDSLLNKGLIVHVETDRNGCWKVVANDVDDGSNVQTNVHADVHADVHAYDDLTRDEKTIFIKIKENPKTLKNELASIIGKSEKTVQRCLNSLIEKKYISRIGTNQYGYWEIIDIND